MSIPLLEFTVASHPVRVASYEVPHDEQPRRFSTDYLTSASDLDGLIRAAYRQIFHEQQMLTSTRQPLLESQLRARQITVKQFIRGLVTSDAFRRLNYEVNNNYRVVELCVQRLLGRSVYHQRETLAWSMVLATQGLAGLVEALLDSPEYQQAFGDQTVPYQRRRVLPLHIYGDLPFERTPRYDTHYRDQVVLPDAARLRAADPPRSEGAGARLALVLVAGALLILALLTFQAVLVTPSS
jgi:phycobilisome rod-core linker protein